MLIFKGKFIKGEGKVGTHAVASCDRSAHILHVVGKDTLPRDPQLE